MKVYLGLVVLAAMVGLAPERVPASSATRCQTIPEPARAEDLPEDVAAFAKGRPIVGEGALWLLINRPEFIPRFDVERDQWVLAKVVWYPRSPGPIEILERRVGSSQRLTTELIGDSFANGFTFRVNSLSFPRGGCWRVTARLHDSAVRFDVRVPSGVPAVCDDITRQVRELRDIPIEENLSRASALEAVLREKGCDAPGESD